MIKKEVAVIGLGLAGETVGYGFQQRNYHTLLINGSEQDNQTISSAKNVLVLRGYDGLAGDRNLALEALKNNIDIVKKIKEIEQKIVLPIASGGGTTGSGSITHVSDIICANPEKIVCPIVLMPRKDESIQKRINAYNTVKELMEIEELGAMILVNNDAHKDLQKINETLINMLDRFFTDSSVSKGSNFDDSEKMRMLREHGVFVLAMLSGKDKSVSTQDMINVLTAKNIFLPLMNDGVVGNIGIINQKDNHLDEHEIIQAVGTPENIFTGNNGTANIVCLSGLSFPVDYISELGKSAVEEQRERIGKRRTLQLEEINIGLEESRKTASSQKTSKRRKSSLDLLRELDDDDDSTEMNS